MKDQEHGHGPRAVPVTRRRFVVGGGLSAIATACARPEVMAPARGSLSEATLDHVLSRSLDAAKRAGATYADVRVVRRRSERVSTREDHVVEVQFEESYGVGVRVLAGGAWGFAASAHVDGERAELAARRAVEIAKANAVYARRAVALAPAPVARDAWHTPMEKDPFLVPLGDKIAYLLALWPEVRAVSGVKYATASFEALGEWKVFASSEGSILEQSITRVSPGFEVTAVDAVSGEFESRRHEVAPMQAGWEYVLGSSLAKDARSIGEDAVRKLKSPSVVAGKRDLVLAPSNLWLTIHESIGHSTELDRALGYEADLAGTSFATPDKLGKLRYGPSTLTFYADKTTPGGLATCGYDDDGVKTEKWDLVKDGVFVAYQTTREQAAWVGEKASRGTSYAQDYRSFPFQRMPNVSLAPSAADKTAEELISGVDDGIYVTGDGSWSIDHQRYNFQFGGQMFHEIKGGKIVGALRDVAYQDNTLAFWAACDGIGGAKEWRLNGAMNDGKGEPGQSNPVSHGCPPARFRQIGIVNTNARTRSDRKV